MPAALYYTFGGTRLHQAVLNTGSPPHAPRDACRQGHAPSVSACYSGPTSKKLVVPVSETRSLTLAPGAYQIAASVNAANVRNYYGVDTMKGGMVPQHVDGLSACVRHPRLPAGVGRHRGWTASRKGAWTDRGQLLGSSALPHPALLRNSGFLARLRAVS